MNQPEITFFNTIGEKGNTLECSQKQVARQANRVLAIFRQFSGSPLTPYTVHVIYEDFYNKTPITSIRRAITDLTNQGMLIKTQIKGKGKYHKPNYKWKLASA